MQQIADWLEKLGMSEYAQRFAENRIDFSVLPDLTDRDLEKLGVVLGDRRKMLRAIGELGDARAPVKGPPISTPLSAPSVSTATETSAERRQVTVMFSDLVGSTALSARMDPEDLREVISGYQKCVAETVGRFGGFLAKYMGDGVLVFLVIRRPTRTAVRFYRRCWVMARGPGRGSSRGGPQRTPRVVGSQRTARADIIAMRRLDSGHIPIHNVTSL
jgi:class 3 adenylate cyclase